jgi:hypothetical protein
MNAARAACALVLLVLIGTGCRKPPDPPPAKSHQAKVPPPPAPVEEFKEVDEPEPPLPVTTETVTIKLVANASLQARVSWGRKDLGLAPLTVTRPRGSGPLDILVVAPGYLPLHTRVFTDRDDTLALRLFRDKEAANLPGFRGSATP